MRTIKNIVLLKLNNITQVVAVVCFGLFFTFTTVKAQVGIGTTDPKATLDIQPIDINNTSNGILIPRLTATQVQAMDNHVGEDQNSMIVYITKTFSVIPPEIKYSQINSSGFYYYHYDIVSPTYSQWKKLGSESITAGAGITIKKGVVSATGLELISESNGTNTHTGWRLIGRDPQYYATIGQGSVDFSYNRNGSGITRGGASGNYSTAMGLYTEATATASLAIGYKTKAIGLFSFAMGYNVKALGGASFAMGSKTTASGLFSFAGGSLAKAEGINAIAIGNNANATETNTIAIGSSTGAYKESSIVIGTGRASLTYAPYAIAIGGGAQSYGRESISIGYDISLQGDNNVAIGNNLETYSKSSIALGQFCTRESNPVERFGYSKNNRRLFVIGNGTSKGDKSDALSILRNGKVGININNFEKTYSSYSASNIGHIDEATLQINGLIQSRDIVNSNASSENYKIVVANDKDILKTITKSELQTALSDVRLKERIQPIYIEQDILSQLNPVEYYWNKEGKKHGGNDKLQYGFIAQDIERIFPNMVNKTSGDYQGIDYIQFIAVLTSILQEKSEKIQQLEKKTETLEKRLEILEKLLEK